VRPCFDKGTTEAEVMTAGVTIIIAKEDLYSHKACPTARRRKATQLNEMVSDLVMQQWYTPTVYSGQPSNAQYRARLKCYRILSHCCMQNIGMADVQRILCLALHGSCLLIEACGSRWSAAYLEVSSYYFRPSCSYRRSLGPDVCIIQMFGQAPCLHATILSHT
jgi:hypothetical protein